MPTYEYACRGCGRSLEVVQSFHDAPLTTCESCGGELRKVFSAAGLIFKGSGWHIKDYAGKGGSAGGSGSGASTSSGSSTPSGGKDGAASSGAKEGAAPASGGTASGSSDSGASAPKASKAASTD